jgi:hypothetical protein
MYTIRRVVLALSIGALPVYALAQDKIGMFEMLYFSDNPAYGIEATEPGDFYVECASLDKLIKRGGVLIEAQNLEGFKEALSAARDRFIEWSDVAKLNSVAELDKEMEISSPSVKGYWFQGKWKFDYSQALSYRFKILADGRHVLIINTGKLQAADNQFMDHDGMALVFTTAAEVDSLIAALDPVRVKEYFEEKKKKGDLFR